MRSMKQLVLMASYGDLSSQFARLEYEVSEVLVILIDKDPGHMAGYLVAAEFQMSRKVSMLLELAYFRCVHDKAVQERVAVVCKEIKDILPTRNTFAHGLWGFMKEDFDPDVISVLDMNVKRVGHTKDQWTRAKSARFSIDDIKKLLNRVGAIIRALESIKKDFERVGLQPLNPPEIVAD